jgi:hypothetical protein
VVLPFPAEVFWQEDQHLKIKVALTPIPQQNCGPNQKTSLKNMKISKVKTVIRRNGQLTKSQLAQNIKQRLVVIWCTS